MSSSDEEALSAADLEALKAAEEEDAAEEQRRLDLARRERDDEERAADEARAAASSAENSRDGLFGTALPGPREHAPPRARDESRAGGRLVGGRFVGGRGVGGRGRGRRATQLADAELPSVERADRSTPAPRAIVLSGRGMEGATEPELRALLAPFGALSSLHAPRSGGLAFAQFGVRVALCSLSMSLSRVCPGSAPRPGPRR